MDGNVLSPKSESDVLHLCRMKSYPDGSYEIMAASGPTFHEDGWEAHGWK